MGTKQDLVTTTNLLKIIKKSKFNPSKILLHQLYRILIRIMFEYGSPAFLNTSDNNLKILKTVQY